MFYKPLLDTLTTWVRRQCAFQKAYHELHRLSNRELADLGIKRADIPFVVMDTLRQRIPSRGF